MRCDVELATNLSGAILATFENCSSVAIVFEQQVLGRGCRRVHITTLRIYIPLDRHDPFYSFLCTFDIVMLLQQLLNISLPTSKRLLIRHDLPDLVGLFIGALRFRQSAYLFEIQILIRIALDKVVKGNALLCCIYHLLMIIMNGNQINYYLLLF